MRRNSFAILLLFLLSPGARAQEVGGVELMELTIAQVHRAMLEGTLSARQLTQAYLERIAAYDKVGPSINSLILVNPRALERADSLDAFLRRTGHLTGPLHGIPFIVKDNYDTGDMPTTGGSASLADSRPVDDAYQVRKIRQAGAVVLAKSNMAEFAFTAMETVGSMLPGWTFNPYRLNRVTAGSSGGTAAAVAANLGLVGLGTDTGNSIRGPSSHNALVGIRSTQGLTSRDGIMPLFAHRDVGGPMTRTVEDAVRILDVIAGTDPADPVTAEADAHRPPTYLDALDPDLTGMRIGVAGQLAYTKTADAEVLERFEDALRDLEALGATVVRDFTIPRLDSLRKNLYCPRFRYDIERYLATLPDAPVRTLKEISESGKVHVTVMPRVLRFLKFEGTPETNEQCVAARDGEERLRRAVRDAMAGARVQALVYPTWNNPPRLVGDLTSPHGNNSPILSPPTGFPAITVPMGFVRDGTLPAGLQIYGDAWSEPTLIRIAYAYEQATRHRKPPPTTPPLGKEAPPCRYHSLGADTIAQLSEEELAAQPDGGGSSVATLVWHVSGNLASRFTDFLTADGERPWRAREEEFARRQASPDEVKEKWDEGFGVLFSTLNTLADAHLDHTVTIRRQPLRVIEALHRSLAHTAYHVGQMIYRGKEIKGNAWRYLSIPPGGTDAYNRNPDRERFPVTDSSAEPNEENHEAS